MKMQPHIGVVAPVEGVAVACIVLCQEGGIAGLTCRRIRNPTLTLIMMCLPRSWNTRIKFLKDSTYDYIVVFALS